MKELLPFTVSVMLGVACYALLQACSGNTQHDTKTVHDAVILADDACTVIKDIAPDGGVVSSICAKEKELAPFINLIAAARVSDAGLAGVKPGISRPCK